MRDLILELIAAIESPQKGSQRRVALEKARQALDTIAPEKEVATNG